MPLTSETRLGPYELTELLGSGGNGEVYKAIDTRLNRTVAIKLLKGPNTDRLVHEAQLIAALNNPHICAVYDIGLDSTGSSLFMLKAVLSGRGDELIDPARVNLLR